MAVRWAPGAVLRVPLPEGRHAFALMLETFPYIAFYADSSGLDTAAKPDEDPLFILAVMRGAYSKDGWGKPVNKVPPGSLPAIPLFFRQNMMDPADCVLTDAEGTTRK